jgi:tryptophan synthase beta subunit
MDCLAELEEGFTKANNDPKFWEEFRSYYPYMGRESSCHLANRLTEKAGGANIYSLNPTVACLVNLEAESNIALQHQVMRNKFPEVVYVT